MIRTRSMFVAIAALFVIPYARAEEPAPAKAQPPLGMRLALPALSPRYGEAIQVDLLVENRSKKVVHFFHDARLSGALRIELTDKNGMVWRATGTPLGLLPYARTPRPGIALPLVFPGSPYGSVLPIRPGQRMRLALRISHFTPVNAPGSKRGYAWLGGLAPGAYSLRVTYRKDDINVPIGPTKVNPRLLQVLPPYELQPYPGLFTGTLSAEAALTVVAPSVSVVDRLKQRVRELKAENARLRAAVDKIRKTLEDV